MSNVILFYGKNGSYPEFSNFYLSDFTIDGETYPSVEHYFMWEKARMFDPDGEAIKQMSNEKTPQQMKKLGKMVKNFDAQEWDDYSADIMLRGLMAKFNQNEILKKKLLDTEGAILAEASPFDRKWGIGMGVSNPDSRDPEKWRGKNLLGQLLMKTRTDTKYTPISKKFYHLVLDVKDNTGTELERYERMEDVFCDIQEWLANENKYSYPVLTFFDYHAMHLEACIVTVLPMVGEPWDRRFDTSEYPRIDKSVRKKFKDIASNIEFEGCSIRFYHDFVTKIENLETKNAAIFITQPSLSEFGQYCMALMYGFAEFPTDEDGNPCYIYGVFDLRTKPFLSDVEETLDENP